MIQVSEQVPTASGVGATAEHEHVRSPTLFGTASIKYPWPHHAGARNFLQQVGAALSRHLRYGISPSLEPLAIQIGRTPSSTPADKVEAMLEYHRPLRRRGLHERGSVEVQAKQSHMDARPTRAWINRQLELRRRRCAGFEAGRGQAEGGPVRDGLPAGRHPLNGLGSASGRATTSTPCSGRGRSPTPVRSRRRRQHAMEKFADGYSKSDFLLRLQRDRGAWLEADLRS